MKATELIKALTESVKHNGDHEVWVGANIESKRVENRLFDVLSGNEQVLLVSKGFMDEDPLMKLPQISVVPDGGYTEPN